jgi:hypothetical protein
VVTQLLADDSPKPNRDVVILGSPPKNVLTTADDSNPESPGARVVST